ncbi:isochorismatase family protein [Pelagibius sp.]|uniref:isochorismatase family protein n=1 Tax=Pelagibius sp. TaxID=1931238 RepID=UPI002625CF99|nr:isochorismatase family protein [Pelagibius sp.]
MVNISDTTIVQPAVVSKTLGLLVVDLQTRLAPAIPESAAVVARISRLLSAAEAAGLPVLATEQYSKGLGPTVPELRRHVAEECIFEKTAFAAPREGGFRDVLSGLGLRTLMVAGMEAHVCVQQTVLCLLEQGFAVHLVGDAVASRVPLNKAVALHRMAAAGAHITDTEAALVWLGGLQSNRPPARRA